MRLRLAVFLLSAIFLVYQWPAVKTQVVEPFLSSFKQSEVPPIQVEEVFSAINNHRTENKVMALVRDEKLDRAALARLSVIVNDDDFEGTKTGVTTENAVDNNGYNYGLIGDLYAGGVNGESNLIEEWSDREEAKKTLLEPRFRDIGIAVQKSGDTYLVMVILGRKESSPVERTGAGGYPVVTWGGIELWEAINKRRVEFGVNPLSRRDELCTVAAIRLNQLLDLGKLDGHAGFEPLLNRDDLKSLREKYTISEFLIVGYPTPAASVAAWENTLGHKALLAGGEYVWGCVYAQNTFGVAIAAY